MPTHNPRHASHDPLPIPALKGEVSHGKSMTRTERSLLLYLETRATDHGGLVAVVDNRGNRIVTGEEMNIASSWNESGFVLFGRLTMDSIEKLPQSTHWCQLSDEAWDIAHKIRKEKYQSANSRRQWVKTEEV